MSGLLGQALPAAATWVTIYTCPAGEIAVMRVIVSNRAGAATNFSVQAVKSGGTPGGEHEIGSEVPIEANTPASSIGFVLSGGDFVRVRSANGDVAFTATGETRDDV